MVTLALTRLIDLAGGADGQSVYFITLVVLVHGIGRRRSRRRQFDEPRRDTRGRMPLPRRCRPLRRSGVRARPVEPATTAVQLARADDVEQACVPSCSSCVGAEHEAAAGDSSRGRCRPAGWSPRRQLPPPGQQVRYYADRIDLCVHSCEIASGVASASVKGRDVGGCTAASAGSLHRMAAGEAMAPAL